MKFHYIAASDLIPQLHKERGRKRSFLALLVLSEVEGLTTENRRLVCLPAKKLSLNDLCEAIFLYRTDNESDRAYIRRTGQ